MIDRLSKSVIVMGVVGAVWLNVTQPAFGPNPAFALRVEPASSLAASRINPGYGE